MQSLQIASKLQKTHESSQSTLKDFIFIISEVVSYLPEGDSLNSGKLF